MTTVENSMVAIAGYFSAIQNGPSKRLEKMIAKDEIYSYLYARDVLKGPFVSGERTIQRDDVYALDYQFRYHRDICSSEQLLRHPLYAISYAIMIHGRFPEGEPAMKKSPRIWRRYKEFLGEPAMKKSPRIWRWYKEFIDESR